MATFTCLAAARHEVLRAHGWNVERHGLQQAPRLTVVAGDELHVSVVGALRLLGIGSEELVRVPVDGQGRMRTDALVAALGDIGGPVIVCVQAGNVNTGASDPMPPIIEATHARRGWVHVDGAFGLWAAGVPELASHVAGIERGVQASWMWQVYTQRYKQPVSIWAETQLKVAKEAAV